MLNQMVLVGRIANEIEKEEGTKAKIIIAVPRNFKNTDGEYETDFIPCVLSGGIATNVIEYCKQGDLVGIKGRVQCTKINDENAIELIAEKLTFLSSNSKDKAE